jgi:hypothetical protein
LGALASYFKTEVNSFRTLPKSLSKSKTPDVASALSKAHARHVDALAFVLAEGRHSVRNRIAHYDFVSAGCINLNARGFFLLGGGEELAISDSSTVTTLASAFAERLARLHTCVDDMIDSFIQSACARETAGSTQREMGSE